MDLYGYIETLRPGNCIIAAIAAYIGFAVAFEQIYFNWQIAVAMCAAFLICGAGQAINDYFDREVDAKIRPEKAIPSGKARPKAVFLLSIVLFAAGVLLAYPLPLEAFLIAIVSVLLLFSYSACLSRYKYLGNWIVAGEMALTLIFGAAIVGNYSVVVLLAISALFAGVAREITKDFEDLEADKGVKKSLPMLVGEKIAKLKVIGQYVIALGIAFGIFFVGIVSSFGYLVLIIVSAVVFVLAVVKLLHNNYRKSHLFSKIGMLAALLAYLSIAVGI